MLKKLRIVWFVILSTLLIVVPQVADAQVEELLSISVRAGFDGRFRENQWTPLLVRLENRGNPISGSLVVRPETSGSGLPNTFSTPVDLPTNSSQSLFLYIAPRGNANIVRVELINEAGSVAASRDVTIREILPRDQLYVLVTQSTAGAVDLTGLTVGGYQAFQAFWTTDNVPDKAWALDSVDMMMFSDVDTGTLSPAQREAVRQWIISGGHLIVTGGGTWQATSAGVEDLIPLQPTSSTTIDDVTPLALLAGQHDTQLDGQIIIAEGTLIDAARVLAETEAGQPLAARRQLGNGTVDYLAVDPAVQPLRNWIDLPEMWYTLLSSVDARPSWSYGFANWERATTAIEILPGIDLLPAVLGLIAFLGAYIVLIGPLNYLILNRLNRREYAWFTMPILIVIFSVLAWSVGFEVRGNQATLSRITVVQTYPDSENARVDQLIGLLAPRRDNYDLAVTDDRMLRPVSASLANASVLGSRTQTDANIQQTTRFEAVDFPVDASFIASFNATGLIPKPDIGGRLTLTSENRIDAVQQLQGSIRNDSDITLFDPVILARGIAYHLNEAFEPGDLLTFTGNDLTLAASGGAVPSPMEYAAGDADPFLATTTMGFRGSLSAYASNASNSAIDIMGIDNYVTFNFRVSLSDDELTQETRRRQAFLDAFVIDQFASTGRGNRVYLAGWTGQAPTMEEVGGASYDTVDTTLYLIELDVERDSSSGDDVIITQDQFSWVSRVREGVTDLGPVNINLFTEVELIFRFTPLPDAVLSEVDELTIIVERSRSSFSNNMVELWNWEDETWELITLEAEQTLTLRDPRSSTEPSFHRFLGPLNAVQMRIARESAGGSVAVTRLGVEQRGRF